MERVETQHREMAGVGPSTALQALDRRRLARAVTADDAHSLTLIDIEDHPVNDDASSMSLRESAHRDRRRIALAWHRPAPESLSRPSSAPPSSAAMTENCRYLPAALGHSLRHGDEGAITTTTSPGAR